MVVPLSNVNRASLAALKFARSLSHDVTAVIVDIDPQTTAAVQAIWQDWDLSIPLVILPSPYRSVLRPLLAYLEETDRREPERGPSVVVLPEIVPARWWQNMLHNQTALVLKTALLFGQDVTSDPRVIINVPYHLRV